MAVDLVRKEDGERLKLSNQIWGFILQMAEENGWEPEGTSLLDEETEEVSKVKVGGSAPGKGASVSNPAESAIFCRPSTLSFDISTVPSKMNV